MMEYTQWNIMPLLVDKCTFHVLGYIAAMAMPSLLKTLCWLHNANPAHHFSFETQLTKV